MAPFCGDESDKLWNRYADCAIVERTYHEIIVLEAMPPSSWLKSCARLTWIPMVEFTTKSIMLDLDSRIRIIWHSRNGFENGLKIRPDIEQFYIPFAVEVDNPAFQKSIPGAVKVLIHERSRSFNPWKMTKLLEKISRIEVHLLATSNPPGDWVRPSNLKKLEIGWMTNVQWKAAALECDIYVASRAHEGVGICVQEAASLGCAIIGPKETTTGEYFSSQDNGGYIVNLQQIEDSKMLCPVYEWEHNQNSSLEDLVKAIQLLSFDIALLESTKNAAPKRMLNLHSEWSSKVESLFNPGLIHQKQHVPRDSNYVLSIQTCRAGGQGLQEIWGLRELAKKSNVSLFSTNLFTQNLDVPEETEFSRLMSGINLKQIAPFPSDLDTASPDYILLHWSSGWIQNGPKDIWEDLVGWLKKRNCPLVVFIHETNPTWWDERVFPELVVYPSSAALQAHSQIHEKFAKAVLNHFIDPEIVDSILPEKPRLPLQIGMVSRLTWSKFDPAYYQEIAQSLEHVKHNVRFRWMASSCKSHYREDEELQSLICPEIISCFGPSRVKILEEFSIGLVVNARPETFCLGAVEMAICGAAIVTNRQEVYEVLGNAPLLVSSPQECGIVLRQLVENPKLLREIQNNCRKAAQMLPTASQWQRSLWNLLTNVNRPKKWSVIITAHDVEAWIEDALRSAISACPSQIVIVLDGCSDATESKVDKFLHQYTENQGLTDTDKRTEIEFKALKFDGHGHSAAWSVKRGLEAASGDLVAFLDGDDMIEPRALKRIELEYNSNPRLAATWSMQHVMDNDGYMVNTSFSSDINGNDILESIQNGNNTVSHLITARASLAKICGLDDTMETGFEKDLMLRLEELGDVLFVPEKLYTYRWYRPGSITCEKRSKQLECHNLVLESACKRRSLVKKYIHK